MADDDGHRRPNCAGAARRGRADQPAGVDRRHENQEVEPAEGRADLQRRPANQPASRPNTHPFASAASQTVGNRIAGKAKQAQGCGAKGGDQRHAARQTAAYLGNCRQHHATASTLTAGKSRR